MSSEVSAALPLAPAPALRVAPALRAAGGLASGAGSAAAPSAVPLRREDGAVANAGPVERLHAGTPAFRRTAWGMFVGGYATFAMLYGFQPLLPQFALDFHLSPAAASAVMSAATGTLALSLIPAGILADGFGRKGIMNLALLLAALLTLACAFAGDFSHLVLLRGVLGFVLAGLPAVAMAYLSEEVAPASLGRSMGLYIAGNALGGMSGRLIVSMLGDWCSWRVATALLGVLGLLATVAFRQCLPASRHFHPVRPSLGRLLDDCRRHFADPGLRSLFAISFLLCGSFVSVYNYLGFQLAQAPFGLRPSQAGLVFSLYLTGIWSSAWAGKLADRVGRRRVLWLMIGVMAAGLALTLVPLLAMIVLGVAVFTFGFFAAHSVASSWVGRRATTARALASALYLAAYYLGSSTLGSVSGMMWGVDGWRGIVALLALALAACMALALRLRKLEPLPLAPAHA